MTKKSKARSDDVADCHAIARNRGLTVMIIEGLQSHTTPSLRGIRQDAEAISEIATLLIVTGSLLVTYFFGYFGRTLKIIQSQRIIEEKISDMV
ncbi:hypothetical protein JCM13991_16360 [Thermodesulfovibrio hydrogeniphilus]